MLEELSGALRLTAALDKVASWTAVAQHPQITLSNQHCEAMALRT